MSKHYKSVFENEQDLLQALIDLHLGGQDIELDPMYFKGNFYKNGINDPKYKFDLTPRVLGVEQADAQDLPLPDNSIERMILDPPFMFGNHGLVFDSRNLTLELTFIVFLCDTTHNIDLENLRGFWKIVTKLFLTHVPVSI